MKLKILYIFLIGFIVGVLGDDSDILNINGGIATDIPAASTVNSSISPPINPSHTTTTISPETTTTSTTTITPNSTTTAATTTTTKATTTTTTVSPAPTTTSKTNVTSTTESTTAVPTTPPSHKGRKFDGPSFIGGIILSAGLTAICFVSWKFYKARTERNYHTL